MKHHFIPTKMARVKKTEWRNWNLHALLVGMSSGSAALENSCQKLNIKLLYDLEIPLLNVYQRENGCPYKFLHMDVHTSIIHNS